MNSYDKPRLLKIPITLWFRLVRTLRARGENRRESGAFLLGSRTGQIDKVKVFVPYDDLDASALDTGFVRIQSSGFAKLWKICREQNLRVLCDIHTHPGEAIQSPSDKSNPMISEPEHVALILPDFGRRSWMKFNGVRVFEYAGDYRWVAVEPTDRFHRVCFCLL